MRAAPDARDLLPHVARHTELLLETLATVADPAAPSLCEGWSRGHVATHVARNAEALERLSLWALDGRPRPMYEGGTAGRDAAIEAGAGRPVDELVTDVRTTAERLAPVLDRVVDGRWAADRVEMRGGLLVSPATLPFLRLREVVFHHADLDARFGFGDVEPELQDVLVRDAVARLRDTDLALELRADDGRTWRVGGAGVAPVVEGSAGALLLWLARRRPDGVRSTGPLPELPRGS